MSARRGLPDQSLIDEALAEEDIVAEEGENDEIDEDLAYVAAQLAKNEKFHKALLEKVKQVKQLAYISHRVCFCCNSRAPTSLANVQVLNVEVSVISLT